MAETKCQAKGAFIYRPTAMLVQVDVCEEREFNRENS